MEGLLTTKQNSLVLICINTKYNYFQLNIHNLDAPNAVRGSANSNEK